MGEKRWCFPASSQTTWQRDYYRLKLKVEGQFRFVAPTLLYNHMLLSRREQLQTRWKSWTWKGVTLTSAADCTDTNWWFGMFNIDYYFNQRKQIWLRVYVSTLIIARSCPELWEPTAPKTVCGLKENVILHFKRSRKTQPAVSGNLESRLGLR